MKAIWQNDDIIEKALANTNDIKLLKQLIEKISD